MNIFNPFRLNSKLAAEVATLNSKNAALKDENLTLDALLKQSRHYGELQLALRQKADRRRMTAESEHDAAVAKLAKIAALGTLGMSATVAKAVVLAGGVDVRRDIIRAKCAALRAEKAAVMEAF